MKSILLVNELYINEPTQPIALDRLCGISLLERHVRTLRKCGVDSIVLAVPDVDQWDRSVNADSRWAKGLVVVDEAAMVSTLAAEDLQVFLIAADFFIEKRFIEILTEQSAPCVLVEHSQPESVTRGNAASEASIGCALLNRADLEKRVESGALCWQDIVEPLVENASIETVDVSLISTYNPAIRRHRRNMWMRITERSKLALAKTWIIDGAQKGSLDLPAQKLHAPIENYIVSRLCETPITPNQITLITNIAAWSVTWAILAGYLWPALIAAAFVGILDGLDGKLARVKMMTSKFGEFEHLFDMLFEYSWWLSLGWVLGGGDPNSAAFLAGVCLVVLNFADSLLSVVFWIALGRIHSRILDNYTPFELLVRKVSGRRNIYIWIMLVSGVFVGLENALWLSVWWGVITFFVRGSRTLWLLSTRRAPMNFAF